MVDGLEGKVALFTEIGKDHIDSDLFQKTTNWIGRAFSKIFSKSSHNSAVSNLIESIKTNPNFGDKYANFAQAKLTSALGRGKPLTGRLAAKILQDVRINKSENLAIRSIIDVNIDTAFETHSTEFNKIIDEMIESKFYDGAEEAFSSGDKKEILNEIKESLKSTFKENSPTLDEMKEKITSTIRMKCNLKVSRHCDSLSKEVNTGLSEKIHGKLEELGFDFSLCEDVMFFLEKKIGKSISNEFSFKIDDHLINSEDAQTIRDRIIDQTCEAFTTVKESGLDKTTCQKIYNILAGNISSLPSKEQALSLCQGITSGVPQNLFDSLEQFNPETDLFKIMTDFFQGVDESVIDPDTELPRKGMDAGPMNSLRDGFAIFAGKLESPVSKGMMTKVRSFIDTATEFLDNSDPMRADSRIGHISLLKSLVAKGFGLSSEVATKEFMKENPDIPENALGLIKQVYDEIPVPLQDDALELIKQNCTGSKGLPLDAKIIVTEEDTVKLSCNTTVTIDQDIFIEELSSSTTVSSEKVDNVNMTKQFAMDLSRGEIRFKTDDEETDTVFTKQEGIDGEREPEALFEKLKTACRGKSNEAFALSVLLNQQFPGSVSMPVSKLESFGITGGGGVMIGAGLEHGEYDVVNHENGKYTVSYSAHAQQGMLTGGSMENLDISPKLIGPDGQEVRLGLTFSYDIDLSEIGETFSEVELSKLITFNKGPDISLEFVDK